MTTETKVGTVTDGDRTSQVPGARQSPGRRVTNWVLSFVLGIFVGVVVHYVLYRISLPLEPFVYVAF